MLTIGTTERKVFLKALYGSQKLILQAYGTDIRIALKDRAVRDAAVDVTSTSADAAKYGYSGTPTWTVGELLQVFATGGVVCKGVIWITDIDATHVYFKTTRDSPAFTPVSGDLVRIPADFLLTEEGVGMRGVDTSSIPVVRMKSLTAPKAVNLIINPLGQGTDFFF